MTENGIPSLHDLPDLITVREAAQVLRVCDASVRAAVNAGDLPAVRLGRRMVIPRAAIERLVAVAT